MRHFALFGIVLKDKYVLDSFRSVGFIKCTVEKIDSNTQISNILKMFSDN